MNLNWMWLSFGTQNRDVKDTQSLRPLEEPNSSSSKKGSVCVQVMKNIKKKCVEVSAENLDKVLKVCTESVDSGVETAVC